MPMLILQSYKVLKQKKKKTCNQTECNNQENMVDIEVASWFSLIVVATFLYPYHFRWIQPHIHRIPSFPQSSLQLLFLLCSCFKQQSRPCCAKAEYSHTVFITGMASRIRSIMGKTILTGTPH